MPYVGGQRHSGAGRSTPYTVDPGTAFKRGTSAGAPGVPSPPRSWHKIAKGWYASLAASGQAQWFEASDWGTAFVAGELLSQICSQGFQSPGLLREFNAMSRRLLATEGDRRAARIELVRDDDLGDADEEAAEAVVVELRGRLGGAGS